MSDHLCTVHRDGYCPRCDAAADRAAEYKAERDVEREDWPDGALWNVTPEYGEQLRRGGW